MNWRGVSGGLGEWSWYYDLPNGWSACVHDDSQVRAPRRPTSYRISAACAHWMRQGNDCYYTLAEAKQEAIKWAMLQPDKCSGPATPYHFCPDEGIVMPDAGKRQINSEVFHAFLPPRIRH